MKTLIYGLQSSGASLFSYWLSQQENCIGVIDLYFNQVSPFIDHDNVVLKCCITKDIPLEFHVESFKPDQIILFIRNPITNHLSLSEKSYSNSGGSIEDKLSLLETYFSQKKFDTVIKYEDFISKRLPSHVGCPSYFQFKKTIENVKEYNFLKSDWCRTKYKKGWGIGNIHINDLNVLNCKLHPNLSEIY